MSPVVYSVTTRETFAKLGVSVFVDAGTDDLEYSGLVDIDVVSSGTKT